MLHIRSHFLVTRGFPELVPTVLLWWSCLSSTHGPFPSFPRSVFSCVLVWQLHCSSIPGVHLCVALCHHLLKVLSETCGYKTPSYEYNCGVINNVYVNYPVKVNVQLHWCESQKHQLCQIETWRAGNFATSSDFRKFAFVLSGKRARGKLQVPSALLK